MIDSLWQDVRQQWQASSVLRLGGWAIAIILLVYVLLWLDDELALRQLEWQRAEADIADSRSLEQQGYWPAVVKARQERRERLLAEAWDYKTAGLAKAAVREFVDKAASESPLKLRVRNIELTEPQPIMEGVDEMRGRLTVSAEERGAPWAWIAELEGASPAFYIDSLDLRVGRKSGAALIIDFRVLVTGLENEGAGK
ncbi:hypothetical protein [Marinobacter sp. NFXS9]|uniref:hypothetical protein n=1 Tax=Marinobacter sp. NFXS9 TaxID=2818433 RepID=UPI0032E02DE4